LQDPLAALNGAAGVLGLEACESLVEDALNRWTQQWPTSRSQL
jgi:hypothetical protein